MEQLSSLLSGLTVSSTERRDLLTNLRTYCLSHNCDWDFWAEQARVYFSVPRQYFDLSRQQSSQGEQRFLEVSTKFVLLPESGAFRKGNQIGGIYEAYAGIIEALLRDDVVGLNFFLSRLSPSLRRFLRLSILNGQPIDPVLEGRLKPETTQRLFTDLFSPEELSLLSRDPRLAPLLSGQESDLSLLARKPNFDLFRKLYLQVAEGKLALEQLLLATIESGNIDLVDNLLPYRPSSSPAYLQAAYRSGNLQMVEKVRSRDQIDIDKKELLVNLLQPYLPNPVGTYQILQQIPLTPQNKIWTIKNLPIRDLDILRLLMEGLNQDQTENFLDWALFINMGNVNIMTHLLPDYAGVVETSNKTYYEYILNPDSRHETQKDQKFPLSNLIIAAYSKELESIQT